MCAVRLFSLPSFDLLQVKEAEQGYHGAYYRQEKAKEIRAYLASLGLGLHSNAFIGNEIWVSLIRSHAES